MPETKRAMQALSCAVSDEFTAQYTGWIPPNNARFGVSLTFQFTSGQSDIDGPVKRTIDATFRALRVLTDSPKANDARVYLLSVQKQVGDPPFVRVVVSLLDNTTSP